MGLICKVYLTQRPKLNKKNCILHEFPLPLAKKLLRSAADSILMPPTFHITSLNRYTPRKLTTAREWTWCHPGPSKRKDSATKLDEFSKKFQTAFDPPSNYWKIMLQIFHDGYACIYAGRHRPDIIS